MNRPYIICHMMTSMDGKIVGDFMGEEKTNYFYEQYGKIMTEYASDAGMMGRPTFQEMGMGEFTAPSGSAPAIPKTDYVATKESKEYTIAVDPSGRLGWTESSAFEGPEGSDNNSIVIVTEKASDAYLSHLRSLGISYLFGGKEEIDFKQIANKLKEVFNIERVSVLGGGALNGLLLNEELIDEVSIVLMPFADGAANSKTIFDINPNIRKITSVDFELSNVEKLENNGLWLKYTKQSN